MLSDILENLWIYIMADNPTNSNKRRNSGDLVVGAIADTAQRIDHSTSVPIHELYKKNMHRFCYITPTPPLIPKRAFYIDDRDMFTMEYANYMLHHLVNTASLVEKRSKIRNNLVTHTYHLSYVLFKIIQLIPEWEKDDKRRERCVKEMTKYLKSSLGNICYASIFIIAFIKGIEVETYEDMYNELQLIKFKSKDLNLVQDETQKAAKALHDAEKIEEKGYDPKLKQEFIEYRLNCDKRIAHVRTMKEEVRRKNEQAMFFFDRMIEKIKFEFKDLHGFNTACELTDSRMLGLKKEYDEAIKANETGMLTEEAWIGAKKATEVEDQIRAYLQTPKSTTDLKALKDLMQTGVGAKIFRDYQQQANKINAEFTTIIKDCKANGIRLGLFNENTWNLCSSKKYRADTDDEEFAEDRSPFISFATPDTHEDDKRVQQSDDDDRQGPVTRAKANGKTPPSPKKH